MNSAEICEIRVATTKNVDNRLPVNARLPVHEADLIAARRPTEY